MKNKGSLCDGVPGGICEAVRECYKEYIGMVKIIYYEGAQRSRQERPGEVAGNCSGTAGKERPQAFATMDAEVGETLDGTPRKRSRAPREDVKVEGILEPRQGWLMIRKG
ncbi:hypothetical protein CTI12_AA137390 [Artemisia annua]|uniref:Uncharacterized protein n=1 Tax=Artemisia annua TaxID=35608 RepID=A0A2U1NS90_ARTAN|nr:hypothetical protein CTI12_AA137390 [Artemisia annua]